MFRHRLHLRRWAARVLILWLFGVGASLANACLASTHDHDAGGPPHHDGARDHRGAAGHANCQDFCDKTRVTIASLKTALDDGHGSVCPPPVVVIDGPVPVALPAQSWVPCRDGRWAPPILITFLRLAL